jgi:hypothetical protein
MNKDLKKFWWINLSILVLSPVTILVDNFVERLFNFSPVYILLPLFAVIAWLITCLMFYKVYLEHKEKFVIIPIVLLPLVFLFFRNYYAPFTIVILIVLTQILTTFKIFKKS